MADDSASTDLRTEIVRYGMNLEAARKESLSELPGPPFGTAPRRVQALDNQSDPHGCIPKLRSMTRCLANTSRMKRLSAGRNLLTPR